MHRRAWAKDVGGAGCLPAMFLTKGLFTSYDFSSRSQLPHLAPRARRGARLDQRLPEELFSSAHLGCDAGEL